MTHEDVPERCDVAVIGGGPAGSTTATLLAQKGYDVVLLERARHPRYNVGESLIPHFWKYCELTGSDSLIEDDGFVEKAGGTVVWDGVIRQMSFADFGYRRPALHVERDRFDEILLAHARNVGATVVEECAVTEVTPDATSPRVTYRRVGSGERGELACRFFVDASGQTAVVARQLGIRVIDEGFRFMSVWGYFEGGRYVAADGRAYPVEMLRSLPPTTFVSNLGGWSWLWHIPQRASTSVGLVISQEEVRAIKESDVALETYFVRRCREIPHLSELLEEAEYVEGSFHAIRDYSYRPTELVGPGFFLVGDAAAFTDPIFSIGIVLGMYSGWLVTWAIDRSLRNSSRTAGNQRAFAKQFGTRLEASRSLALPRYGYGGDNAEGVRQAISFETSLEQELMYVVSTLTTRSENFLEMARNGHESRIPASSAKYRVLDEIAFER